MFHVRILASALFALSMAVPALAQETAAPPATEIASASPVSTTDAEQRPPAAPLTIPQLPAESPIKGGNVFKLSAGDFKNFFSADTGHTLAYTAIVAIAAAPWDREGVNNGFNLPTPVFQGGNVIGNFVF